MKKQQTVTGRIVKVECAGASYMGNPFWKITIDTDDGYFRGKNDPEWLFVVRGGKLLPPTSYRDLSYNKNGANRNRRPRKERTITKVERIWKRKRCSMENYIIVTPPEWGAERLLMMREFLTNEDYEINY